MTEEAQRIAIAEACGWTILNYPNKYIPDYLHDLNAINSAVRYASENLMDADQWEEFGRQLERVHSSAVVCFRGKIDYYDLASLIVELTPANYCEAFLRTLGLWKED